MKVRLDKLLLERGLTTSRERAQALILAGKVLVGGQKVEKAGTGVDMEADIRLLGDDLKYVGRGGLKLEKALEHWNVGEQAPTPVVWSRLSTIRSPGSCSSSSPAGAPSRLRS